MGFQIGSFGGYMGERRAWEKGTEPLQRAAASRRPGQNRCPPQQKPAPVFGAGAGTRDALPGRGLDQSPESRSHAKRPGGDCGCPQVFAPARTHSCGRTTGGLGAGKMIGFAPGRSVGCVRAGADAPSAETQSKVLTLAPRFFPLISQDGLGKATCPGLSAPPDSSLASIPGLQAGLADCRQLRQNPGRGKLCIKTKPLRFQHQTSC